MGHAQEKLEQQFSKLAQALDNALEDSFGDKYKRHPNRPKRGSGANPSFDGLFATTVAFTLGYGSKFGRGYIVNVDLRTLDSVTPEDRTAIQDFAFDFLKTNIRTIIPERELTVVHDGKLIKIIGNFSL